MEAKDTVMPPGKLQELFDSTSFEDLAEKVAEAQAEISFKAGQKKASDCYENWIQKTVIPDSKQVGRKEVVEWIERHPSSYDGWGQEWQAQKKEWFKKQKEE